MAATSAQISLYPLGRESLSSAIDQALEIFHQYDLAVHPGEMSTLVVGDEATVFAALQAAYRRVAGQGRLVLVVTLSSACPVDRGGNRSSPQGFEVDS
jgi:uncharacterized protein YqgV (UPF0045/DUF77 family)